MLQTHTTLCVYPRDFVFLALLLFSGVVLNHGSCVQCLSLSVEVESMLCFILEGPQ